ncbi:MAG: hypothetical protein IIU42_03180, partial [Ruminococcus sp.]|nr:hypothetical protein [Ruminococcus sp.]
MIFDGLLMTMPPKVNSPIFIKVRNRLMVFGIRFISFYFVCLGMASLLQQRGPLLFPDASVRESYFFCAFLLCLLSGTSSPKLFTPLTELLGQTKSS